MLANCVGHTPRFAERRAERRGKKAVNNPDVTEKLSAPATSAPASGWTAGQRIMMVSPERCKGMAGIISGVSGNGETLLVQFDGNEYNSIVGSHQVQQSNVKGQR